jgi:hypothetical protein
MVKSNQQPLPSLGAEVVTLGLSVGKGVNEPQAKAEVIEPRKRDK